MCAISNAQLEIISSNRNLYIKSRYNYGYLMIVNCSWNHDTFKFLYTCNTWRMINLRKTTLRMIFFSVRWCSVYFSVGDYKEESSLASWWRMEDGGDHAQSSKNRELRMAGGGGKNRNQLRIARKTLAWLRTRFVWLWLVILWVLKSFLWALLFLRLFLDLCCPILQRPIPPDPPWSPLIHPHPPPVFTGFAIPIFCYFNSSRRLWFVIWKAFTFTIGRKL